MRSLRPIQPVAVVAAGDFEQHELRLSHGAGQILLQVVQPLEMGRAADRKALYGGRASGVSERVRVDPPFGEARPNQKNHWPITVVIGEFVQQVVEGALRRQPKPRDHGRQPAPGQDEATENEQRSAARNGRSGRVRGGR
jgi:hypothetical protein